MSRPRPLSAADRATLERRADHLERLLTEEPDRRGASWDEAEVRALRRALMVDTKMGRVLTENDLLRERLEATTEMLRDHVTDWGDCDALDPADDDPRDPCVCSHARTIRLLDERWTR